MVLRFVYLLLPTAILGAAHSVFGAIAFDLERLRLLWTCAHCAICALRTVPGRTGAVVKLSAVALVATCMASRGECFDPTAISGGIQAVGGIIGGIDAADSAADVGFALTDLLEETGITPDEDVELNASVARLKELQKKAADLEWSGMQIRDALKNDLTRADSVANKLRALRIMVDASKQIAQIMQIRPKAGEKAVAIQQVRINSMILDELQSMRKAQVIALLQEREAKAKREIFIEEIRGKSNKRKKSIW